MCKGPEDLLNFLNSQRPYDNFPIRKRYDNASNTRLNKASNDGSNTNSDLICFNCKAKGHTYLKCPRRLVKYQRCQRVDHTRCQAYKPLVGSEHRLYKVQNLKLRKVSDRRASKTTVLWLVGKAHRCIIAKPRFKYRRA